MIKMLRITAAAAGILPFVLAGFAKSSPPKPAQLNQIVGFGVNWGASRGVVTHMGDSAGIAYVRTGASWAWIEYQQGNLTRLAGTDSVMDSLAAINPDAKIIFEISKTPLWASAASCRNDNPGEEVDCPPLSQYWDDWQNFVDTILTRYPEIDYVETWNEAYEEHDTIPPYHNWKGELYLLDSIIQRAAQVVDNHTGIQFACCGSAGSRTTYANTLNRLAVNDSLIDVVTTHSYGWAEGSQPVAGPVGVVRTLLSALGTGGYDQPVLLTEFGPGGDAGWGHSQDTNYRDFINEVLDSTQTINKWDASFYYSWDRFDDKDSSHIATPTNWPYAALSSLNKPATYCSLVDRAGNTTNRCPRPSIYEGLDTVWVDLLNPETCTWKARTSGGTAPFSYEWQANWGPGWIEALDVDSVYQYAVERGEVFDLRVEVVDNVGAVAWSNPFRVAGVSESGYPDCLGNWH